MKRIPEELIQEIRLKSDIVDVISEYVTLEQRGNNHWGLCPFHDDNNPSMSVSSDKQIFKCFVCGHGGNVFQFVQDYEKISFIDSVIKLGYKNNFDLSAYEQKTIEIDPEIKNNIKLMEEASSFYEYQMITDEGESAKKQMLSRGYDANLLKKFRVGYAPQNNALTDFLLAKGYARKDLLKLNLSREYEKGLRDVFFNRITFPIENKRGEVVAFTARSTDKKHNIKYINSSETPVYKKSDIVYNYHRAYKACRELNSVIIVEGVIDVMAFAKAGYKNAVSYLGVAASDQQIDDSLKMNRNVVLAFDGDSAGLKASYEIGKRFKSAGANVYIWKNNNPLDPDDLVREVGIEVLKQTIDEKVEWLDFLLKYGQKLYGLNSFENKKKYAKFVVEELKNEDQLTQEYYLQKIEDLTDLKAETLQSYFSNQNRIVENKTIRFSQEKKSLNLNERWILKQMMISKDAAYQFRDDLGFLINKEANDLAIFILDMYRDYDYFDLADFLSFSKTQKYRELLFEIIESNIPDIYNSKELSYYLAMEKKKFHEMGFGQIKEETLSEESVEKRKLLLRDAINKKQEGDR